MCNNFYGVHASVVTRVLRVTRLIQETTEFHSVGKSKGRAEGHAGVSVVETREKTGEGEVLIHIDEISMRGYKVSAIARRGNGVTVNSSRG